MIKIATRLRPFSHQPGILCMIPKSAYCVRVYPMYVQILTLSLEVVKEHVFDSKGPLKEFSVMQDLERECVTIWSESYRCHILPTLEIVFGKKPGVPCTLHQERLSFGCHKTQEFEAIKKRRHFSEIFPIWFRLGALISEKPVLGMGGAFSLLEECQRAIDANRSELLIPAFEKLFQVSFQGMFVPRLEDNEHQGIIEHSAIGSPLALLSLSSSMIRSLFVDIKDSTLSILPHLPPELHAGRFLGIQGPKCSVDLEWTKKTLRRMEIRSVDTTLLTLRFPSFIKSYRLRKKDGERGKSVLCGEPLELKSGCVYLLDQFQK